MAEMEKLKELKKIFLYVSSTVAQLEAVVGDNNETLKQLIVNKSLQKDYNDRIFFIAATNEIITHGTVFGASKEISDKVAKLEDNIKVLVGDAGVDASGNVTEIVDDTAKSAIAKYVHSKMSKVSAADASIVVTPSEAGAEGIDYAVKVDTTAIVDGDTIVSANGKLKTDITLELVHEVPAGEEAEKPFLVLRSNSDTNAEHPLAKFNVSEFVTDGMLESVRYDVASNSIIFKWNGDAGIQETPISVKDLLKLEEIHSTNDYIKVDRSDPNHETKKDGSYCYDVEAQVSDVDLTKAINVKFTEESTVDGVVTPASFSKVEDADESHHDTLATIRKAKTLADTEKVADKFSAVEDEIVTTGNTLLDKLAKLKASLNDEIDRAKEVEADHETRITANTDAITVLNGDEKTDGSVAKSIADKIADLKTELTLDEPLKAEGGVLVNKDNQKVGALVTAYINQVKGKIEEFNLTVKTDTLGDTNAGAHQNDTPDYTDGNGFNYYVKSLDNVAGNDPALITSQDAWLYGQAMFGKTVKAIRDDSNQYIHIDYIAGENDKIGHPQIQFEPWGEITDKGSLDTLVTNYN